MVSHDHECCPNEVDLIVFNGHYWPDICCPWLSMLLLSSIVSKSNSTRVLHSVDYPAQHSPNNYIRCIGVQSKWDVWSWVNEDGMFTNSVFQYLEGILTFWCPHKLGWQRVMGSSREWG